MKYATTEATKRYADKFKAKFAPGAYRTLGKTGLTTSALGFGCYRVDVSVDEHREALEKALLSGCNLIDTSTNYADGGSEECVGEVLEDLIKDGKIAREEVIVVSKVGYVQGQNMGLVQHHEKEGKPFSDVVKYAEGCWHCIHPEFIEDQLVRSLERTRLERLDVYLLHNPEYYLMAAAKHPVKGGVAAARTEFYRRIREAFKFLEGAVKAGTISYYGVSSNSFVASPGDNEFTSLTEMMAIAREVGKEMNGNPDSNHFAVVQLPANLMESGLVLEKSNGEDGKLSPLYFCQKSNLGILVNRPLNAIFNDKLIRLSEFKVSDTGQTIEKLQDDAIALEKKFALELTGDITTTDDSIAPTEFFRWGSQLKSVYLGGITVDQWRDYRAYVIDPQLNNVVEQLNGFFAVRNNEEWTGWREQYLKTLGMLLAQVEYNAAIRGQKHTDEINAKMNPLLPPSVAKAPLSQKSLAILANTPGVSCVLNGMRRAAYVEDSMAAMKLDAIPNAKEIYEAVKPPAEVV